jgi:predicted nuclease of predicted toxin-antitoxin system
MKFLIDMNLSPLWVQFLADSGFDSIHWSDIGQPFAPDTEIMDHAAANGLVIFTHDLDFGALLAKRRVRQPSVIQVRTQDVLPTAIGEIVVRALHAAARIWKPAPWSPWTRIGTGFGFCQFSRSDFRGIREYAP